MLAPSLMGHFLMTSRMARPTSLVSEVVVIGAWYGLATPLPNWLYVAAAAPPALCDTWGVDERASEQDINTKREREKEPVPPAGP